jgi:valyl-tRNA synthetase
MDDFVDPKFGTGAVKITPAHDQNDYEAGKRHSLPMITVIGTDGHMTSDVPEAYRGLTVQEARDKVVADLDEAGALVKTEEHLHNVGHCYKCDTVIQPLLRDQWFVDMQPLAKPAIEALEAKKITFYPEAKREQLIRYLEGLRDWNISRQIAWGIPIPAFQNVDNPEDWIYDERVDQEIITVDGKTYHRDPDVFDTWFSSSSWPYATLDYPDSDDFKQFYPLSLMETGGEILQPWVSRMIMLGLYVTGEIPFKEVYIHGYVMAEDGAKMSKSLGNVVDPLPVIAEYGSDALRMGIINGRQAAVNRGYDQRKVEDGRNFANKLWNIARYIENLVGDTTEREQPKPVSAADHWVLSKLQQSQETIGLYLDTYRFSEAYETLYHFVWDDVADWYIEASKAAPNLPLLMHVLEIGRAHV